MNAPPYYRMLVALLLCTAAGLTRDLTAAPDVDPRLEPRRVILLIGDGMDDQQITIARNYLRGASGELVLDTLPLRASVQVLATEDRDNGAPVYVSDSANTATAMATGVVTSRGRIATSPGADADLTTIVELAAAAGLRTGLVTTASVTDATPAAFAAHINSRRCEDPEHMVDVSFYGIPIADCSGDLKASGGRGSIAEQLAESPLDVILGGGGKHFTPPVEGGATTVTDLAGSRGFQLVTTTEGLLEADPGKRLLGLFAPGTMPVRLRGEGGRTAEAPRRSFLNYIHPYLGSVELPEPMTCEPNPKNSAVPTLQQMTEAALANLGRDNGAGFFLMVESASIDKQAHERKPCGSIGELAQLEETLLTVLAFADTHPNTLVMVTADHAHAAQLVPNESLFAAYPVPVFTPGKLARIRTPEGGLMAVNYATNDFAQEEHTGAAVPLYSNEEGVGRIPPFLAQPQIFLITREYLGI